MQNKSKDGEPQHHSPAWRDTMWEATRQDISLDEQTLETPQWHKDILDEREGLVAEGKAEFIDWEEAKKRIREATQ